MGVDNAALMRVARGILTEIGCVPEGVKNVCRNQSETGNQMRITPDEFSDTVRWVSGEVGSELGVPGYEIPVNPREIKFDPRPLINAAKIFHVAGEKWTLSSHAWDHTNFGLFSGDDGLAACMAGRIYEAAEIVKAKRIVISECGHGYRCARWDGYNWTGRKQKVFVESVVEVILRYIEDGLIMVDRARNNRPVTFHDSCNTSRYGNLLEEPRRILKKVCMDFREMHPDRIKNFCCGAGGGLLVIPDYRDLRLDAAKFKAQQLKKAEADIVCTICYNCREGLGDLIEHYNLNMKVVQVMDLVNNALVLPEKFM
jgi:Fe-S oxidoreductase